MDKRNKLLQIETVRPATLTVFVKEMIKSLEAFESGQIDSLLFVKITTNAVIDLIEDQEHHTT